VRCLAVRERESESERERGRERKRERERKQERERERAERGLGAGACKKTLALTRQALSSGEGTLGIALHHFRHENDSSQGQNLVLTGLFLAFRSIAVTLRCSSLIRTSTHKKCSGSAKITTHLDHVDHCKTAPGKNWSNR